MESSATTETFQPITDPAYLGDRFYNLLAEGLFGCGVPLFCGEHPYYHIDMIRRASGRRFSVLDTPPRSPFEALTHAQNYIKGGTNAVIVYRGRARPNERLESLGFNRHDNTTYEHRAKVRLIDLSAAAQLYDELPGDVYDDFARISSTGPNKGGALIGGTAERHLAIMNDRGMLDFDFDEVRVPPETQSSANVISRKGGKIIAIDLRNNPAKWKGFYVLDIDKYVITASSLARWV